MLAILGIIGVFGVPAPAQAQTVDVVVLGDSISAGLGVKNGRSWVADLKAAIQPLTLANASISGDTTGGGRQRLPGLITRFRPSVVIIELGANDGLRLAPLQTTHGNLSAMVREVLRFGAVPILLEVPIPSNAGPVYLEQYRQVFRDVSQRFGIQLIQSPIPSVWSWEEFAPFLQRDGVHPTREGHVMLAEYAIPMLRTTMTETLARKRALHTKPSSQSN